jgi:hypothetical protein
MTPADSEVTTPSLEAVLRLHLPVDDGEGFFCSCSSTAVLLEEGIATSYTPEHLAAVLLASFVLVPKDQLHQETLIIEAITEHLHFTRECPCGEWVDSGPGRRRVQHNYAEHVAMAAWARLVGPWRQEKQT